MGLHNLWKTFDLVEYPVLLKKLLEAGVNGKMWRLLKNWYECGCGQVKLDGRLSDVYDRDRFYILLTLFLLVMDLQISGVGLSSNSFYAVCVCVCAWWGEGGGVPPCQ